MYGPLEVSPPHDSLEGRYSVTTRRQGTPPPEKDGHTTLPFTDPEGLTTRDRTGIRTPGWVEGTLASPSKKSDYQDPPTPVPPGEQDGSFSHFLPPGPSGRPGSLSSVW